MSQVRVVWGVIAFGFVLGFGATASAQVCGDNAVNQLIEQCDGTDDLACPGACLPSCICAVCGDDSVNQLSEQCDGTDDATCPGNCLPNCICAVCGDDDINQTSEECDGTDDASCPGGCAGDCTCPLDHFQCYEVKRRVFTPIPVSIEDQFGLTPSVNVDRAERLCKPADKNNEDAGAENDPDHLAGYRLRHAFVPVRAQVVQNQFGTVTVDVLRPKWLMVPSSINLASPPPVVDHFQCYKVKRSRGSAKFSPIPGVTVVDGLGSYAETLVRPKYLCAPADKNGEDPTAPTHPDHLLCYKTRSPRLLGVINQFVQNQFGAQLGQQAFDLVHRVEFCVPSLKNPTTTTTTTSTTSSTVTTTSAPSTTSTSTSTSTSTTSTSTSTSTTTTTLYGSPSRAFVDRVGGLLD